MTWRGRGGAAAAQGSRTGAARGGAAARQAGGPAWLSHSRGLSEGWRPRRRAMPCPALPGRGSAVSLQTPISMRPHAGRPRHGTRHGTAYGTARHTARPAPNRTAILVYARPTPGLRLAAAGHGSAHLAAAFNHFELRPLDLALVLLVIPFGSASFRPVAGDEKPQNTSPNEKAQFCYYGLH